jgi:chromosome segregation ATPase
MARETLASLRAKNEELEAQNKKYFDAWLKLDQERQKEVTESAQYKALKEHYELEQKNSKALGSMLADARSKNNKYLDELNTLKRKIQADPEDQQTAYMELQTKYEKLKMEYETVKTLCERTLEVHSALQSDYKTLQAELQQAHTQCHTESHNARGAGRKPVLTVDQRQKILEFHAEGKSLRWIASQIGVTHTAIAKIIKKEIN